MHEIYIRIFVIRYGYFRDWTKVPAHMYRMIVEGNVSKGDVEELRREGILQENNRGEATEFVFHEPRLEGAVHIVKKNKENLEKKKN